MRTERHRNGGQATCGESLRSASDIRPLPPQLKGVSPNAEHALMPEGRREARGSRELFAVSEPSAGGRTAALTIYVVAFVTGAIVMSFEMLGSRYLNPYFGSGIYTWASLISTVLAALT